MKLSFFGGALMCRGRPKCRTKIRNPVKSQTRHENNDDMRSKREKKMHRWQESGLKTRTNLLNLFWNLFFDTFLSNFEKPHPLLVDLGYCSGPWASIKLRILPVRGSEINPMTNFRRTVWHDQPTLPSAWLRKVERRTCRRATEWHGWHLECGTRSTSL